MWVILYLLAMIALLMAAQSVVLLRFKQPLQWTFGASSQQSKSLKLALKVVLQTTLIGSIFLFPYLVGSRPAAYYAPLFPREKAHYFWYGEGIALALLTLIYAVEVAGKWLYWEPRWTAKKAFTKSALSALSSLTVVAVEEPFFRGIILRTMLESASPWTVAIPLSAALFSAAHFIRKVKTYWPAVGLAMLGVWLGVAYYKTGNLWLSMGLHSGGILSIGVHRCFLNYRGPAWLVGTQTFPIAGAISIAIMAVGTAITWVLFSSPR
jgi:membrane protease YdiL (CAAX protease family)